MRNYQKFLSLICVCLICNFNIYAQPGKTQDFSVSKDFIKKDLLMQMQNPHGAPISPDDQFTTANIVWINNLQDLLGRVVEISTIDGKPVVINILDDLKSDTVKIKPNLSLDFKNEFKKTYKNSNVGEIGFMGISIGANFNFEYSYTDNTVAIATVLPNKIDKSKIKDEFKCNSGDCKFAYINAAAVRVCEVRTFRERSRGGKIKPTELSGVLAKLSGLDGKVQLSRINEDITKKYQIFYTVVRIP